MASILTYVETHIDNDDMPIKSVRIHHDYLCVSFVNTVEEDFPLQAVTQENCRCQ